MEYIVYLTVESSANFCTDNILAKLMNKALTWQQYPGERTKLWIQMILSRLQAVPGSDTFWTWMWSPSMWTWWACVYVCVVMSVSTDCTYCSCDWQEAIITNKDNVEDRGWAKEVIHEQPHFAEPFAQHPPAGQVIGDVHRDAKGTWNTHTKHTHRCTHTSHWWFTSHQHQYSHFPIPSQFLGVRCITCGRKLATRRSSRKPVTL